MAQDQLDTAVYTIEKFTKKIIKQLKNDSSEILSELRGPLSQKVSKIRLEEPNSALKRIIIKANMASETAGRQALLLLDQIDLDDAIEFNTVVSVHFRRISMSRIQASCDLSGLSFIWESMSISHNHDWCLRRITFPDSDDEEYYWRPWQMSLDEADIEYKEYKQSVEHLERPDILDTDLAWIRSASTSSTSSSINSDDQIDLSLPTFQVKYSLFMTWKSQPEEHARVQLPVDETADGPDVDYWDRYDLECC